MIDPADMLDPDLCTPFNVVAVPANSNEHDKDVLGGGSGTGCKFKENFLNFLCLYHLLFDLETIGVGQIIIWWLIFEKKPNQFWREIWISYLIRTV